MQNTVAGAGHSQSPIQTRKVIIPDLGGTNAKIMVSM